MVLEKDVYLSFFGLVLGLKKNKQQVQRSPIYLSSPIFPYC